MKIICFLILLLCFIQNASAVVGLADWSMKTPAGNEINNFDGNVNLYLKNNLQVSNLNRWYFYKFYIIADCHNKFSIIDERTAQIIQFFNKDSFENSLTQKNIKPKLWTRWHTKASITIDDIIFYAFMLIISVTLIGRAIWNLEMPSWNLSLLIVVLLIMFAKFYFDNTLESF